MVRPIKVIKGFKRWRTTYSCAIGDCKKLPGGKRTFKTYEECQEHLKLHKKGLYGGIKGR